MQLGLLALAGQDSITLCPAPEHDVARQLPRLCDPASSAGHVCVDLVPHHEEVARCMMAAWGVRLKHGRLCLACCTLIDVQGSALSPDDQG